jgi:hypothetical protein
MVSRGNGVDDGVQHGERNPMVGMVSPIASRTCTEGRPEQRWPSGAVAGADLLQVRI